MAPGSSVRIARRSGAKVRLRRGGLLDLSTLALQCRAADGEGPRGIVDRLRSFSHEPTADFPGLVDLVWDEKTGQVQFWCKRPTEVGGLWFVQTVVQPNGEQWVAPDRRSLPWPLPRRAEVERWFKEDTNEAYFEALCAWIDAEVRLHTFATTHILNGKPIGWVSMMLGHEDEETTRRYY